MSRDGRCNGTGPESGLNHYVPFRRNPSYGGRVEWGYKVRIRKHPPNGEGMESRETRRGRRHENLQGQTLSHRESDRDYSRKRKREKLDGASVVPVSYSCSTPGTSRNCYSRSGVLSPSHKGPPWYEIGIRSAWSGKRRVQIGVGCGGTPDLPRFSNP